MTKKPFSVLVIAAHPDDEVGCAGTLFKLKARGAKLFEIVLTDAGEGRDKRKGTKTQNTTALRQDEMKAVGRFLGLEEIFFMSQEDLALTYSKELMLKLVAIIRKVKPTIIFLMNRADFHPDHQAAYKLGLEAAKWASTGIRPDLGASYRTKLILQMGGMWPIRPDLMVDVTKFQDKKIELFKLHGSQADSRAVEFEKAMMTIYGYQHRTGSNTKAEAFQFCREFPSSGLVEL